MQRTILVPLDGSEVSEASLPLATKLAQERGLPVTLARVVEYPHFGGGVWPEDTMTVETYEQVLAAEEEEARSYLEGVRQRLAEPGLHVETIVRRGNPSVALLDLADELSAETIVIASHGHGGFKRFLLGSVAMQLVSHTTVPVFLVRAVPADERRLPKLDRLLVPLDGSVLAERALDVARDVRSAASTLVLVRVVVWPGSGGRESSGGQARDAEVTGHDVTSAREYLEGVAASLRQANVTVETQVIVSESKGTISRHLAVAATARDVDAIVMSTHGRGGVTGWLLGSVADEVVRNVDRPVLLVSARAIAARTTGRVSVGDVMTRDVVVVHDDESLEVALRKLVRRRASGAPVVDADGQLIGVISQRDIMAWRARTVEEFARQGAPAQDAYLRQLRSVPVREIMSTPATSVQESASLASALALLRDRGVHRLPVLQNGQLTGILTGSDVLLAMLAQIDAADDESSRPDEPQSST